MKNVVRLTLALCALALTSPASAAEQRHTLGFGVSYVPFAAPSAILPTAELYLPIQVAPAVRLEPSLGIFTNDEPTPGTDTRDITIGLGAFWVKPLAPPFDMYVGGRLKLNFAKRTDTNAAGASVSDSDTDLYLMAALGGEYYVVPQLSVGLEGELGLYSRGAVHGDDSGFFTTGLAFLRLYFF
jgi:hypothetical protein